VSDQIANDGGKDPERIVGLVSSDRLVVETRGSTALADHGLHTVGLTTFSKTSLEQATTSGSEIEISFYACWDSTGVRVINSAGSDVTPPDRTNRQTREVVVATVHGKLPLVLESDDVWSGSSSC
jgi:hypothetical protein